MKMRFEILGRNCEECGNPAKWMCYEIPNTMVAKIDNIHYYCDKCKEGK